MRHLMQHWAQSYWRDVALAEGDEGRPFVHTASNQLGPRGLKPGDRLYVVGNDAGELLLIGRMDVAHVVEEAEAKARLGESAVFPRRWHAIARPPYQPLSFERRVPERLARAIRMENGDALKIDPSHYRVSAQGLITARFLCRQSAEALDALFQGEPAESDEVCDVEAVARGRRPKVSAEQRKAIESHAVAEATSYFEGEGWRVEDVGLVRSYDLHCTKGPRILYVEVKGTTGTLSTVPLTANEVELANGRYPDTALFVLSDITLDGSPTEPVPREGGTVLVEMPWRPKQGCLRAIAYSYGLA